MYWIRQVPALRMYPIDPPIWNWLVTNVITDIYVYLYEEYYRAYTHSLSGELGYDWNVPIARILVQNNKNCSSSR